MWIEVDTHASNTRISMYSSHSTCVEVDWSGIKLNSIPFHSNTCGFMWIHIYPNKARYKVQQKLMPTCK